MTDDERRTRAVERWLEETSAPPPPTGTSVDQVMSHLSLTPQEQASLWRRLFRRRPDSSQATEVTGRTRSMLNPFSAAAAAVLALAAAGIFLVGQPDPDRSGTMDAAEAQLTSPVRFSATYDIGPGIVFESTTDTPGVGARSTGGVWQWSVVQEATDERMRGSTFVHRNHDSYRSDQALDINYSMLRIENEGGSWQSLPVLYAADATGPAFPVTFIGEDGYEGLYAVGTLSRPSGFWELDGYIFEGSPLPAPEPYLAE